MNIVIEATLIEITRIPLLQKNPVRPNFKKKKKSTRIPDLNTYRAQNEHCLNNQLIACHSVCSIQLQLNIIVIVITLIVLNLGCSVIVSCVGITTLQFIMDDAPWKLELCHPLAECQAS